MSELLLKSLLVGVVGGVIYFLLALWRETMQRGERITRRDRLGLQIRRAIRAYEKETGETVRAVDIERIPPVKDARMMVTVIVPIHGSDDE